MRKKIVTFLLIMIMAAMSACGKEEVTVADEETVEETVELTEEAEPEEEDEISENYKAYAELLRQFMGGEYRNIDWDYYAGLNEDSADEMTDGKYVFALKDIDGNGEEELLIRCDRYFIAMTADSSWSDAGSVLFQGYDDKEKILVSKTEDHSVGPTSYRFDAGKLTAIEQSQYKNAYYENFGDCPKSFARWYSLDEYHIGRVLLGEQQPETTADWKQVYAECVHEWNQKHIGDYNLGYEMIYLDEDDIPELCLIADNEFGGELAKVYTIIGDKTALVAEKKTGFGANYGVYYEKSGLFAFGEAYACGYANYGNLLDNGMIIHDVLCDHEENSMKENDGDTYCILDKCYMFINDSNEIYEDICFDVNEDIENRIINTKMDVFRLKKESEKSLGNAVDYQTICGELGAEPELKVPAEYELYYEMMSRFLKSNRYSTDCIKLVGEEGFEFYPNETYSFMFGLIDINQDGVEELVVKPVFDNDYNHTFFVLIPEKDYSKSVLGYYHCYDENAHTLGRVYAMDVVWESEFYSLNGDTTENVCGYSCMGDLEGDGTYDTFCKHDSEGRHELTKEEFDAELSNVTYDLKIEWHELNADNLKKVFLGL